MKILQIVGYKNSGKTTLSKDIITYLSCKGIKVGSLKNHGHGGVPLGIKNTDSEQHRKAGAEVAGVIGENVFQLSQDDSWEIGSILAIYEQLGIDLLLVEGFKKLEYPKLVMLKEEADFSLLQELRNIIGIVNSGGLTIDTHDYPIFDLSDKHAVCDWIHQHYLEEI